MFWRDKEKKALYIKKIWTLFAIRRQQSRLQWTENYNELRLDDVKYEEQQIQETKELWSRKLVKKNALYQ